MKWKEWNVIAQNENFWVNYEERGLLKAVHKKDYILELWFEDDLDVSIYELDFYQLLIEDDPGDIFLFLRNKELFKNVIGNYSLMWKKTNEDTGIDIAPECVRFFCERYGKLLKGKSDKIVNIN